MKKLFTIILLLVSLNITAQNKHRERIKSLKISVITKKLDLTVKEAQQFWPIYNTNEKKISAIKFKEIKAIRKEIREHIDTMTNEKANKLLNRLNSAETRIHQLRTDLTNKLSGIISSKKIIQLKLAEDDFKRRMLQEYKKRKKEKG